jgi:hypothetical protein
MRKRTRASFLDEVLDPEKRLMLQPRSETDPRRDTGVTDGQFTERAGTALRSALQAHLKQPVTDQNLRRALGALCIDARRRDVRPEQLILILKQVWSNLPELQHRNANRQQDVLDRIVTICIEEYYGS